ncbi:hypothetical protein LCGC14_1262810 [marine sediment metagenome]|uniref:Uncharacterized protein n=1 Tax=marine sediment metagenome TaxID=412755 RepID=A0A0F9L2G8_9ZZZZ
MGTQAKSYQWTYPSDWLNEKIGDWSVAELRSALNSILATLAEDDVQDTFQSDMEADGYFECE